MPTRNAKGWVYWIGLLVAAIGLVALVNGLIHLLVGQTMGPPMMQGSMMNQSMMRGGMAGGMPGGMMAYFAHSWLRAVDRIVFGVIFLGVGAYMLSEGKKGK